MKITVTFNKNAAHLIWELLLDVIVGTKCVACNEEVTAETLGGIWKNNEGETILMHSNPMCVLKGSMHLPKDF